MSLQRQALFLLCGLFLRIAAAQDVLQQARIGMLNGDVEGTVATLRLAIDKSDRNTLFRARLLEALGEQYHRLSDIDEAKHNWDEALLIRQQLFGDSSAAAAVGYAYQARYHDFMAAPQPDHQPKAFEFAEKAKRLLLRPSSHVELGERVLILREYAYAFKVSHATGSSDWHEVLLRTRSLFHEALITAQQAKDTIWIAQVTHDIANTYTDEAGRYNQQITAARVHALLDSGITCYQRSIALMTAAGLGTSEAVMMDHFAIGLLFKNAYDADSAMLCIGAYDDALRTMLAQQGHPSTVSVLQYEPRIANKAQMIELLYIRGLAFEALFSKSKSVEALMSTMHSLEAAVPYWKALLRDYRSIGIQKVLGSYSHFPFQYGTEVAARLFSITSDSSYLRQAFAWSEMNRDALEQRDRISAGVVGPHQDATIAADKLPDVPEGTVCIAFHRHSELLAFVIDHEGTTIQWPEQSKSHSSDIGSWNRDLRRAMDVNDVRAYRRIAYSIYESSIAGALTRRGVMNLVVVPCGSLCFLPFEALVTDTLGSANWGALHYVQDRVDVRYARSVQEAFEPTVLVPLSAMAFAVPDVSGLSTLPFADELGSSQTRERRGRLLKGHVSRSTILGLLHDGIPLHIATHAEALALPDVLPRILLSDTALSLADIDDLRSHCPFLVLSTCSGGEGRVYIGEGAMSLGNAFLRSGVSSVVQTLWPVDDQATSEVLGLMYASMDDGSSASHALNEAKRMFVQTHAHDALGNPFYWSGIVITGTNAQPENSRSWRPWVLPCTAAFLLLVLVATVYFTRSKRASNSRALADS